MLGLVLAPLAGAKGPAIKNGVVHACLKTKGKKSQRGTIHVVNSPKQCKKKGERPLTWSLVGTSSTGTERAAGPQGPVGPGGAAGTAGAPGPTGTTGTTGTTGEKGSAATVDDQLKETINEQTKEIQVLLSKVGSLTTEVLGLEKVSAR
jgi:hypothetical protein